MGLLNLIAGKGIGSMGQPGGLIEKFSQGGLQGLGQPGGLLERFGQGGSGFGGLGKTGGLIDKFQTAFASPTQMPTGSDTGWAGPPGQQDGQSQQGGVLAFLSRLLNGQGQ